MLEKKKIEPIRYSIIFTLTLLAEQEKEEKEFQVLNKYTILLISLFKLRLTYIRLICSTTDSIHRVE